MSVQVRNRRNVAVTLRDGRGDSVTIQPKSTAQVASRFVDWVTPNPRHVRIIHRTDSKVIAPPQSTTPDR